MNGPAPRGFIPPRPNLGPEPWPEDYPASTLLLSLGALLCLCAGWFAWRTIARRRARAKGGSVPARSEPDNTPRGRLLALSHSIRDALTGQFGAAWRAKTTEELSADAQLEVVLGREGLQELIRFLDQVDRLKFAPERSNHRPRSLEAELAAWQPRLDALRQRIQAKGAGRIKGKNGLPAAHDSQGGRLPLARPQPKSGVKA